MVTPTFSFSGIASGLDTDAMVKAIMDAERIPQSRLQVKKAQIDVKQAAWADLTARMGNIKSALDGLKSRSSFDAFVTATSSNEAVKVSATSGAIPQTTSFTVDTLAASHQTASAGFAAGTSLVGAGTFSITRAGTTHEFTTGASTTLDQLAAQINGSTEAGVSASVVRVAEGDTRLVLTARSSGEANVFTTAGTQPGLATSTVNQAGADAVLTMGTLQIRRSSNTFNDLVKGVSITLSATTEDPVTITTGRDPQKAVEGVKKLVDAVNGTLGQLKALTRYDPETKVAGQLQNDASARSLSGKITNALSGMLEGLTGDYQSMTSIGLSIQRDGTYKLDETKLTAALNDDFEAVTALFARSGSAVDSRLSFVAAGAQTGVGNHTVAITQAASAPGITGNAYSVPGADETLSLTAGSRTIDITLAAGDALATAISKINTALSDNGIFDIVASADGGALRLGSSSYGSGSTFTVAGAGAFGLDGTFTGTDVVGTIDGQPATGSGQSLTGTAGSALGLIVRVSATEAEVLGAGGTLALGDMNFTEGVAGRMLSFLETVTGERGVIKLARDRYDNQEKLVDDRIKAFDSRLALREQTLRRQFTAMETALSSLQSQQSYLAGALGGLGGGG